MLYRIAALADWQQARQNGYFASTDLAAEGFIHSSEQHQILETARRYFADQPEVVLLEIDEDLLRQAGVRVEREWVTSRNEAFAHLFGPVPLAAIRREWPFGPDATGAFVLPEDL